MINGFWNFNKYQQEINYAWHARDPNEDDYYQLLRNHEGREKLKAFFKTLVKEK